MELGGPKVSFAYHCPRLCPALRSPVFLHFTSLIGTLYEEWESLVASSRATLRSFLVALSAFTLCGGMARAQTCLGWTERAPNPPALPIDGLRAAAFDSNRGVTVGYGGQPKLGGISTDVAEWNGTAWSMRSSLNNPGNRTGHAMAYDSDRQVVVLFGGGNAIFSDQTWEWDGTNWTALSAGGPWPRYYHAMAYDAARHVTVLYGGSTSPSGNGNQTWEWNGSTWAIKSSAALNVTSGIGMVYDTTRQKVVLYGGGATGNLYEWTGTTWNLISSNGPPNRTFAQVAYDSARSRLVVFGGIAPGPIYYSDTWEWDGSTWAEVSTGKPWQRTAAATAFDSWRNRMVVCGGNRSSPTYLYPDTWEWDGTQWQERESGSPTPRVFHSAAYDPARNRLVIFGGHNGNPNVQFSITYPDTWDWDGTKWHLDAVGGPPGPLASFMSYDSLRGVCVLFGGATSTFASTGQTWEWDGNAWTQRSTTGPSPRYDHVMTFDTARGVTVLYSGQGGSGDTWEWDGLAWTQRADTGPIPIRYTRAMAFDQQRNRSLIFSGSTGLPDTWEWDGSAWSIRSTSGPSARTRHAMAYHSNQQLTYLLGGQVLISPYPYSSEVWRWDGTTWSFLRDMGIPAIGGHSICYNPASDTMLAFGGFQNGIVSDRLWELGPSDLTIRKSLSSARACIGGSAAFSIDACGTSALSYQWRRGMTSLANGGNITGADSPVLSINPVTVDDVAADYNCVVANLSGSATSTNTALIAATANGDGNFNGKTDGLDVQGFVLAFLAGGSPSSLYCPYDMNTSGAVDETDLDLFVSYLLTH